VDSIAIIGLSGAGKTVLAAVLAKFLSSPDNVTGVTLDPVDLKTQAFVDRVWGKLSAGQWPESTALGAPNDLQWRLRSRDGVESEFRIFDVAGQEWFQLFGQEGIKQLEQQSEQVRQAVEYCGNASIVLLVVNLADFIAERDEKRLLENQWTTKYALDLLCLNPPNNSRP
jgi:GTPase SAR1 family protein